MIGWLRFVGLVNAAAWFGTGVFFTLAAGSIGDSRAMAELVQGARYPGFFSEAFSQLVLRRYLYVSIICGCIALLHFGAEWLYFGRSPRRLWLVLVLGLLCWTVFEAAYVSPRLQRLNTIANAPNLTQRQREPAGDSLRRWRSVLRGSDFLVFCALGLYLWRVGNPPDSTRFVSTSKFRS